MRAREVNILLNGCCKEAPGKSIVCMLTLHLADRSAVNSVLSNIIISVCLPADTRHQFRDSARPLSRISPEYSQFCVIWGVLGGTDSSESDGEVMSRFKYAACRADLKIYRFIDLFILQIGVLYIRLK